MKKLIKLLALGSPILFMGCNNTGGSNSSELATGGLGTIRENNVYFNRDNIEPIRTPVIGDILFDEKDHQTNDAWGGITTRTYIDGDKVTALTVSSGRTGSKNTAQWLTSHDYLVGHVPTHYKTTSTTTSTNEITSNNIEFADLPSKYNFAIRGNLLFKYKPNNTEYTCSDIAITQYDAGLFANYWALFSNITPKYRVSASSNTDGSDSSVVIECVNNTSHAMEQFKVTADSNGNTFNITQIKDTDILTDNVLKHDIAAAFNNMPINTRLSTYSKSFDVTKYNPRNLIVYPGVDAKGLQLNDNGSNVSIVLDGEATVNNMDPIPLKSDTLLNCSDTAKEIHSSSFNKTLPSVINTSTNHTLGGSLTNLLPSTDGQLQLNINGQRITTGFKYTKDATQNRYEHSYNAPSISITVAAKSKLKVTATANQFRYSGKFKFIKPVTGTLLLSGFLFNQDSKYLPANISDDFYSKTGATVNIFDTLKYSNSANLNSQIQLDPATRQILLIGDGTYQGEAVGEQYDYIIEDNIPLTDEEIKSLCGNAQGNEESPAESL